MALATLTTKDQVIIPKEIRESLKLHTGDRIEFFVTGNGEAVIRPITKTIDEIFCKLHRSDRKPVTVEDMNNAIKNRMKDKFK